MDQAGCTDRAAPCFLRPSRSNPSKGDLKHNTSLTCPQNQETKQPTNMPTNTNQTGSNQANQNKITVILRLDNWGQRGIPSSSAVERHVLGSWHSPPPRQPCQNKPTNRSPLQRNPPAKLPPVSSARCQAPRSACGRICPPPLPQWQRPTGSACHPPATTWRSLTLASQPVTDAEMQPMATEMDGWPL